MITGTSQIYTARRKLLSYPDPHQGEMPIAHNRESTYEEWQANGPILWCDQILGKGGWFLTSHNACRVAIDSGDLLSCNYLFTPEQNRSPTICSDSWHASNLNIRGQILEIVRIIFEYSFKRYSSGLYSAVDECCRSIFPELKRRGEFELVYDLSWPLLCCLTKFFGIAPNDMWRFPAWESERIGSQFLIELPDPSLELVNAKSLADQFRYMERVVRLRKRTLDDSFIGLLACETEVSSELNNQKLIDQLVCISNALIFGLRDVISGALLLLLENQNEVAVLSSEPILLSSALEEIIRLAAPAQLRFRLAVGDLEIENVKIKKSDLVIAALGSANRDPTKFENPNDLRIRRRNAAEHLADYADNCSFLVREVFRPALAAVITRLLHELPDWRVQTVEWSDALRFRALRRAMIRME